MPTAQDYINVNTYYIRDNRKNTCDEDILEWSTHLYGIIPVSDVLSLVLDYYSGNLYKKSCILNGFIGIHKSSYYPRWCYKDILECSVYLHKIIPVLNVLSLILDYYSDNSHENKTLLKGTMVTPRISYYPYWRNKIFRKERLPKYMFQLDDITIHNYVFSLETYSLKNPLHTKFNICGECAYDINGKLLSSEHIKLYKYIISPSSGYTHTTFVYKYNKKISQWIKTKSAYIC